MSDNYLHNNNIDLAVTKLSQVLNNPEIKDRISDRDSVYKRFKPIFTHEYIDTLTAQEFKDFLLFENNKHWNYIHRHNNKITSDMDKLRDVLRNLLDESKDISRRYDEFTGRQGIHGFGRATTTPILLISQPEKYGVFNSVVESAMRILNILPALERGVSNGQHYKEINQLLLEICRRLNIDLWTLDWLWWYLPESSEEEVIESMPTAKIQVLQSMRFGLEKYLHEFIYDNWESIPAFVDWDIFNDEPLGKYRCDAGEIDILAKHKYEPKWLVIELKRGQSNDVTIGQICRYMGCIKQDENFANEQDEVLGMIISYSNDKALDYSLKVIPNISVKHYKVNFTLE